MDNMFKPAEEIEPGEAVMVFRGSGHHRYTVGKVEVQDRQQTKIILTTGEILVYGNKHQFLLG